MADPTYKSRLPRGILTDLRRRTCITEGTHRAVLRQRISLFSTPPPSLTKRKGSRIRRLSRVVVYEAVRLLLLPLRGVVYTSEAIAVECEEKTRRQNRCLRNRSAQQPAVSVERSLTARDTMPSHHNRHSFTVLPYAYVRPSAYTSSSEGGICLTNENQHPSVVGVCLQTLH